VSNHRETLKKLLKALRSDCDHIRYSCEDIDCYAGPLEREVRALLEENERRKPPSARKMTEDERYFMDHWTGGPAVVVESVDDALRVIGVRGGVVCAE
jgi:hypothetical protein